MAIWNKNLTNNTCNHRQTVWTTLPEVIIFNI